MKERLQVKAVICLLAALLCGSGLLQATTVSQSLYLNRGVFVTVDTISLPALAWNSSSTFSTRNQDILLSPGDSLILTLTNTDTANHIFSVNGNQLPLIPGQTGTLSLHFPATGVFIYQDQEAYPANAYLGATGMIVVDGAADQRFYWNVREAESNRSIALGAGQTVNWNSYHPDYFIVNGLSKPDLENDPTAKVTGAVGDTIHVYMANTGLSRHSMHFHGYHVRIRWASTGTRKKDWFKDTVPVEEGESMILEIVPDKPGIYPVHDHNLIAITGGGYYPNGIFLFMDIN